VEYVNSIRNVTNGTDSVCDESSENAQLADQHEFDDDDEDRGNKLGSYKIDKRLLIKATHLDENYEPMLAAEMQSYVNPSRARNNPDGVNQYTDKAGQNNNIILGSKKSEQGTSKSYSLNRLKRKAPELFGKVIAGEISANNCIKP
jgi:hypothetical protein